MPNNMLVMRRVSPTAAGAIFTDILEFRARVLVIQAVFCPSTQATRAIRLSRAVAFRRTGPRVPVVDCRRSCGRVD